MTDKIKELNNLINDADAVVVGAGSGMSNAAGMNMWYENNELIEKNLKYFTNKYGFKGIFNGFYNQFDSLEEKWAFNVIAWNIILNIMPPKTTYDNLKELIKDKPYHIITTNQDTLFKKYFPEEEVSEIQGSWDYMQSSNPQLDKNLYLARPIIEEALTHLKDHKLPSEFIPKSKIDGSLLQGWVRDPKFLEDKKYHEEYQKFNDFMKNHQKGEKILFLELGVGRMTPMFIQEPFWALTKYMKQAHYVNINPEHALTTPEIEERSLLIPEDIDQVLQQAVAQKRG